MNQLTDAGLREHAIQISEAVGALIELESMKAANQQRIADGYALAYDEDALMELQRTFRLGVNDIVEKSRNFW